MVIKNRSDGMSERFSVFMTKNKGAKSTLINTSYQISVAYVNAFKEDYHTFSLLHKNHIVNFVQKVY